MGKRYLITGITGFAGAHLAQLLHNEGHKVFGMVRKSSGLETDILDVVSVDCYKDITFLYADLEDRESILELFKNNLFDGIFHLAAQSHPPTGLSHPILTMRVNVMGSTYIAEAIEKYQPDCVFMFCSSSEVYGTTGVEGELLKEDGLILPSNPYATSKACFDLYLQERMANKKIKGFITRAFSHCGPRRGKNFSISCDAYQIAQIMRKSGSSIYEIQVGNLDTIRVVVDVRDIVRAYYMLMQVPIEVLNGRVFNICGDTPRRMGYFTDELIRISGLKIGKVVSDKLYRPIDIQYQNGDTTRLKNLTGWEPKIPIDQTLSDLLNYWIKKLS